MLQRITIFGVPVDAMTRREAVLTLSELLDRGDNAAVFTPNPSMILRCLREPALKRLLGTGDLLLPDGVGILLAARLAGYSLPCRMTGIDSAELLMALAERRGLSVFLLGGKSGVAKQAAQQLKERFPALHVCGTHHGYFDKIADSLENQALMRVLRQAKPDLLLVGFGFPNQERWIAENAKKLPDLRLAMGVGGSLDVWSGLKKRAPAPFRALGAEWLWRSVSRPRRAVESLEFALLILAFRKMLKREVARSARDAGPMG